MTEHNADSGLPLNERLLAALQGTGLDETEAGDALEAVLCELVTTRQYRAVCSHGASLKATEADARQRVQNLGAYCTDGRVESRMVIEEQPLWEWERTRVTPPGEGHS